MNPVLTSGAKYGVAANTFQADTAWPSARLPSLIGTVSAMHDLGLLHD